MCFALYSAARAAQQAYRPLLDDLGLTYPQYLVLLVLWEQDGQTVSALGDRLHLDSGTLSPLLRRLDEHGFITRERQSTDARRVAVHLPGVGVPGDQRRLVAREGRHRAAPVLLAQRRDGRVGVEPVAAQAEPGRGNVTDAHDHQPGPPTPRLSTTRDVTVP